MRKNAVAMILIVIAFGVELFLSAQVAQPQHPMKTVQDLDKFLKEPLPDKIMLSECQSKNQQWQAWYDETWLPTKAENDRLKAVKSEIALRTFVAFGGIGAGLFAMWRVVKVIRHWWPFSKQRRQLITLLLMATWVTVAALIALNNSQLIYHPVNLVLSVFVYSVPALAFGSVAVWWFGRTKPEELW